MDPGVERPPSARTRRAFLVLFASAPLIVVATLLVPQRVSSRAQATHVRFGYPLHFVEADVSLLWSRPVEWRLNAHEDQARLRPSEFLLDWGLISAALAAPVWLLNRRLP